MSKNLLKRAWALVLALAACALPSAAQVVEYYHLDGLGSVRAVSDQAGVIVEQRDYLPFGEEWCGTAPCAPGVVAAGQPRRFTGKERDAETGLDYFGARYYGAKLGRFTMVDPVLATDESIVDPQGWNRYAYVRNAPFGNVDPDGRHPIAAAAVAEVALAVYDVYDAYATVTDPNASVLEKGISVGGLAVGVFLPAGGYGKAGKEAAAFAVEHAPQARRLLLDTDVIIRQGKEYLTRGADVVKSFVSDIELAALVRRGKLEGVPKAAAQMRPVGLPSLNTRINVRGGLKPTKKSTKRRGNFADGIIGASAIEQKRTLVTYDKGLAGAVRAAGGQAIEPQ